MNCLKLELSKLSNLMKYLGEKVMISGEITKVVTGNTRDEKKYSIVDLKDSNTTYQLAFFGEEYVEYHSILNEGSVIEAICNVDTFKYDPDKARLYYISISDGKRKINPVV